MAASGEDGGDGVGGEAEEGAELRDEALVFEEEGDVVRGRDVVDGDDLVGFDLAEHGDFVDGRFVEGFLTAAGDLKC